MKKFIIVLIGLCMLLSVGYMTMYTMDNRNNSQEEENDLMYKYAKELPFKEDDNYLLAIMTKDKGMKTFDYGFEQVNVGGEDEFLIVPKYKDMKIEIYKMDLNEDGDMDKTYFKTLHDAFYLTCNQSDLYSNVLIKIEYNGSSLEYSPYYSLKDGSLSVESKVLLYE